MFALFSAWYFWVPKILGLQYNKTLGKVHFWVLFIGVNVTFFPQHFLGLQGMPRRISDYPDAFAGWNLVSSFGSIISVVATWLFLYILYIQLVEGKATSRYPWLSPQFYSDSIQTIVSRAHNSLEWGLSSPPKPHAFVSLPLQSNVASPMYVILEGIMYVLPGLDLSKLLSESTIYITQECLDSATNLACIGLGIGILSSGALVSLCSDIYSGTTPETVKSTAEAAMILTDPVINNIDTNLIVAPTFEWIRNSPEFISYINHWHASITYAAMLNWSYVPGNFCLWDEVFDRTSTVYLATLDSYTDAPLEVLLHIQRLLQSDYARLSEAYHSVEQHFFNDPDNVAAVNQGQMYASYLVNRGYYLSEYNKHLQEAIDILSNEMVID